MSHPQRVSSLLVTTEFARVSQLYYDLGFEVVATGDPGCVGFVAGETGVILADTAFARRCWSHGVAEAAKNRFIPYVFLEHIESEAALAELGEVLCDVTTTYGTHELVLRTASGPVVLAERIAS
jgi:hypothetical protein